MTHRLSRLVAQAALAAVLVLAATPVGAQDVGYNAMPGVDFAKYKTYAWVKIEGVRYPDDITDTQIKQAIDTELAAKGLTKAEASSADLLVGYQVAIDQEKQWNAYRMGGAAWGPGYYGRGYGGGGTATATSTTINVGTLGLDMYDRGAKQLVWRGKASKTLDPGAKPEKRAKNLEKAMKKLLKNYPPKDAKKTT